MATVANRPKGRSIKNLRMVWAFALRHPGHIALAALALLMAAGAASSIPYGLKLVITPDEVSWNADRNVR